VCGHYDMFFATFTLVIVVGMMLMRHDNEIQWFYPDDSNDSTHWCFEVLIAHACYGFPIDGRWLMDFGFCCIPTRLLL
jgi:hypothetical protein